LLTAQKKVSKKITKGCILKLTTPDVYNRGERYYRDGKLLNYNATEAVNGELNIRAVIEGNYKNYDVSLNMGRSGDLVTYACSCESYEIWRGACKHVVTVLIAYVEGHAQGFSAEKMRQHASNFTDTMEKIIFDGIDASLAVPVQQSSKAPLMKIAPVLHCVANKGVYLTFLVGFGRMYVIKSVSNFVKSCKTGSTVEYGQGLTFAHKREMFDEPSQKLLDFITREDDMYAEVGKRLSRQFQFALHPLTSSRELMLTERNADEIFSLYEGQIIDSTGDFGEQIKLLTGCPLIHLDIRYTYAGIVLHIKELPHRIFYGQVFSYCLMEGRLYRLPSADGHLIGSLLKAVDDIPSREILLAGNDAVKFKTIVLPQLKRIGIICVETGEAPENDITPLNAIMFFDSEGMDIIGRLEFHYDKLSIDSLNDVGHYAGITRDVVTEYALCRRLASLGFYEVKGIYKLSGSSMIYSFLHGTDGSISGLESLRECAEVLVTYDLQKKTIRPQTPQIGLRLSGDLLKVTLEDTGYEIGELLESLEAYRTKKKFHRLKDGRFIALEDEAIVAVADLLESLDISKKEIKGKSITLPSYRALYVNELTKGDSIIKTHAIKRDSELEHFVSHFQNNASLGFRTPKGLSNVLREYQKTGYYWLRTLAHYNFGGILADDMGLGKTVQVITLLLSERKNGTPSIVVCPTSLLYNWENEIKKFAPQLKSQVISGFPEKRRELLKAPNIDIFITTYDMLKRDIEFYESMNFTFIIADEAQNIKNPSTQAAKSIKQLRGKTRFALTGTPIENTLTELWSIFDFIMPGYLHTVAKFSRLYEIPIIKYNDVTKAAQLRQQIAPFVLRRVKENVLKELPKKIEITLQAELSTEQKKIYQANLLEAIGAFDDIIASNSFADNRMRILAQLTRLRQICCHPALFLEDYEGGSGKLELALETIQLALESGHRVLLFSQFTGMLSLLKNELEENPIILPNEKNAEYFYIDGTVKAKERMEMTTRFNEGERNLFLISLKAGGTGLNLTGADVVIHYDPWWNPSVMDQASDRAHRYGQEKVVQVFNIVAKDSIEEKIMELQEKKRGLIDSVITEGGSFINLLTEDEVRKLFTIT